MLKPGSVFLQAMGRRSHCACATVQAKEKSGRILEGRMWDEMPVSVSLVNV